jgi:outer membrane protein
MSPFKILLIAASFVLASLAFQTPTADAQGSTIITVDQNRVLVESAGGQDIRRKLQAIGQTIQSEIQSEQSALETEGRALEGRLANKSEEAIRADAGLVSQMQSFQRKQQAFVQKRQIRQQELVQTEQNALTEFNTALGPILEQVLAERGADVMMARSSLVAANPALDATDLVISKINAVKPSVTVSRVRLPTQPAAGGQ